MNTLIIGGTGFIGGRLAQRLLDDGHRVTVFTRGKTSNPFVKMENLDYL